MNEEKLEVNRRAIGKTVQVIDNERVWSGEIVNVKDKDTFLIKPHKLNVELEVDIFNVRYL